MRIYQNNLLLLSITLILVVLFIYFPGLNSQFQFDDAPNIIQNKRVHLQSLSLEDISKATLSGTSGSLLQRPISMLSLGINYYFSKLNPFSYKLTNLVIHIFNSLIIFWLSYLLIKKNSSQLSNKTISITAFLITLAWATHPINLTSVLYVVQRMTSLSAFFTLLAMVTYLYAKDKLHQGKINQGIFGLSGVIILAVFSILSKENGALLFVYLFLIECLIYKDFFSSSLKIRQTTRFFFIISLVVPIIIISCYTLYKPEWITAGFAGTAFSLTERVLTEQRIVWLYIFWILFPNNQSLGLFHDDIAISTQLFDNTLPFLAILGHILIIGTLFGLAFKKKYLLLVFGCALFYSSHLIESTILPLELAHEHRNYLGSFGLLFGLLSPVINLANKSIQPIRIILVIYILFLSFLTTQRASTWGNGLESALIEVEHHPKSALAHYELGRQYVSINNYEFRKKSLFHFETASQLDSLRADGLFAILITQARNKLPIEEKLLLDLKYRLKNGPAYASHASWLSVLIGCYKNAKCLLQENDIEGITQAALSNNNLQNNKLTESFTLMAISGFLVSRGHNYQYALKLSTIAANSSPGNVIFIKNIIDLAIAFKDIKTAKHWITVFEKQSYAHLSRKEIQALKNKIPSDI